MFDDFSKDIFTISWWISVVVVGISINIVSAYLKNRIDKYLSGISNIWKRRVAIQDDIRKEKLDYLIANPNEQLFVSMQELRWRGRATYFGCMSIWMMMMAVFIMINPLPYWKFFFLFMAIFSTLSIILAVMSSTSAGRVLALLNDARKSKFNHY